MTPSGSAIISCRSMMTVHLLKVHGEDELSVEQPADIFISTATITDMISQRQEYAWHKPGWDGTCQG
ncbi:MAG: hypothetical protein MZV63_02840 [Marinilabiliales bacterium]|nr:hypothetical protein [Marinilabiliales bacterium]